MRTLAIGWLFCWTAACAAQDTGEAPVLRVGIIGLDTSHAVAFTRLLNAPDARGSLARVRVTAAFAGGSPDIAASRDRIERFCDEIRDMGVTLVDSIETLVGQVDAVLLESVDGRKHLEQIEPVLARQLPVFVDKPVAASLGDVLRLFDRARARGVPCFSSSALRFCPDFARLGRPAARRDAVGCVAFSPAPTEPHHPGLFWYGVHGAEILVTVMGPGCETVQCTRTAGADVVTGVWSDGRVGTLRGVRDGHRDYGALVFGRESITHSVGFTGYRPLVEAIAQFFVDRRVPVPEEETLAIYAFMAAAEESAASGGTVVRVDDVVAAARRGSPASVR